VKTKLSPCFLRRPRGYVSYVAVLSMGIVLLLLLIGAYHTAIRSQESQAASALRIDYAEKEEAVLRAIVPIAANRAMRCMQSGSDASDNDRTPLSWRKIFRSAIEEANAETSVDDSVLRQFGLADAVIGNPGDDTTWSSRTFQENGEYTRPGLNQDLGLGYPVPLQSSNYTVTDRDDFWPVISKDKVYGHLAEGKVGASPTTWPEYTVLPYPNIRFGYAEPGEPFVAKRNWWSFRMDLADHWDDVTGAARRDREFIISIYEVPSQLAISAEAFTVLGEYADGTDWQNATVAGSVFSTRAEVRDGLRLERLASRTGMEFAPSANVGDLDLGTDPFSPGNREQYELTNRSFMPVSLASEAGRAAFIPINRGADFFDRHAHEEETDTISPTTWNDYTVGAIQCAMHLDITEVADEDDPTPTELEFRYLRNGSEQLMTIDLLEGADDDLPPGYIYCADEHQTVTFEHPVDVAYGKNGHYYFEEGVTGTVHFDNSYFGDPLVGTFKAGYYRPSYPFEPSMLHDSKQCITVYPERFDAFLDLIGADGPTVNDSLSINVDYDASPHLDKPSIPCTELDYGVIMRECADLTDFGNGFSLVTNLRLYIADDFNVTETTPPAGSGLPTPYFPPCSLFAPEKRYGAENDPYRLRIAGQLGSLAGDEGPGGESVHLLDMKNASEEDVEHDKVEVNLAPIAHPAALPPVSMMNWLVTIEERSKEFYTGTVQAN